MATRAQKSQQRRQAWHEGRIEQADTPKARLWAACGWLVAEAWRRGRIEEATEVVLTTVHEIREEQMS
ncbi:hypothetical protein [Plantactinospora sp. WMMB782]|uniref:hypothetical protein n=1 Tax=Plantactinospora sp. WMMB782 TaxID=3404121 RepID=UPI003B96491E